MKPGSRIQIPSPGRDDWDDHWQNFAEAARSNPAQRFRQNLILRLLAQDAQERFLDVGSGTGEFAALIARVFPQADVVGIELSGHAIEEASARVARARFVQRDLLDEGSPPPELMSWATQAVCSEVLEHVDDPVRLLCSARAYMAPECKLIVTVPGGPVSAFDRHIGHRRHFSPDELAEILRSAGFAVEMSTGAGFPTFNLYRLVTLAMGDRLVGVAGAAVPSLRTRAAWSIFDTLLSTSARLSRRGWQTVAVARVGEPGSQPPSG